jgi:arylsulfatase A-like enzyme
MASLLTGLYPHEHGAGWVANSRDPLDRSPLAEHLPTLASQLRAAGLHTAAIVTNPYLALRYGFGDGFDSYENLTVQSELFVGSRDVTAMRLLRWAWPGVVVTDRASTVTARAIGWLRGRTAGAPFFLWLHYLDPHPPYSQPGVKLDKSFRGDALTSVSASGPLDLSLTSPDVARLRSGEIRLDAAEKEAVRGLYRAEVAVVDAAVGEVVDELEREGLAADTLLVVAADHGEEFWEHGGVEHGHTTYDELVHVPLLFRWPAKLTPARVRDQVRLIDVMPTVMDLLGIAPPKESDGRSLVPLLAGRPEDDAPPALIESMLFADERVAIRTSSRKFVRWEIDKQEIYDLEADPAERRDLAGIAGERAALASAFDGVHDERFGMRPSRPGRPGIAEEAALRALGYVR